MNRAQRTQVLQDAFAQADDVAADRTLQEKYARYETWVLIRDRKAYLELALMWRREGKRKLVASAIKRARECKAVVAGRSL